LSDNALPYEAQLLYNRAPSFSPISGDLRRWRILIPGAGSLGKLVFEVELTIPEGFPAKPPQLRMITAVDHPAVDKNTKLIHLEVLSRWNSTHHLYQLANILKELFAQPPQEPRMGIQTISVTHEGALNTHTLPMAEREEHLAELKSPTTTPDEVDMKRAPSDAIVELSTATLESEKMALEILIKDLEERYENADISPSDYAKRYKRYRKELNTVERATNTVRTPPTN
jgi:ubiquitin-protein ligase